ncbi:hypothetical protein Ahia01_000724100 [Argonauta hians]
MFIPKEETMSPDCGELNTSDPFCEMSTQSSHSDSGHGSCVGSAGHYEKLPDLCRYQSDGTWNKRNEQTINRSRGDNYDSYHYHPDGDVSTCYPTDPTRFIINDTTLNMPEYPPPHVAMTANCSSNCKPPLPSVSTVTTRSNIS